MKIIYEAIDGKQFDSQTKCEEYEAIMQHTHLDTIDFYDEDNECYHIDYDHLFDDSVYQHAEKIRIRSAEELEDFAWLKDECGWIEFDQIKGCGLWIRQTPDNEYDMGIWKKVKSHHHKKK